MPIHFAVLGPHNRGRISLLAHRPDEGLRLVGACATHLENLDDYPTACGQGFFRIASIEGSHGGADPLLIEDFVTFLRGVKCAGLTAHDVRMAVAVGCQATASLRNGSTPLDIPVPIL